MKLATPDVIGQKTVDTATWIREILRREFEVNATCRHPSPQARIQMEEPLAPPTSHVLRPHHVGLLTAFMLVFKEFEIKPLPPSFNLHMYRVLLNEVSEARLSHIIVTTYVHRYYRLPRPNHTQTF